MAFLTHFSGFSGFLYKFILMPGSWVTSPYSLNHIFSSLYLYRSQVHRRILYDDWRGVGEPLNETGQFGDGLIVRGKHYVLLTTPSKAAYYHRTLGEEVYMSPSVMLSEGDEQWTEKYNTTVSFMTEIAESETL